MFNTKTAFLSRLRIGHRFIHCLCQRIRSQGVGIGINNAWSLKGYCVWLVVTCLSVAPVTRAERLVDDQLRQLLKDTIAGADSFVDRFDAEVWLMAMSGRLERFEKNPKKRLRLLRSIHRAASRAGLQPEIVLAVIEIESRFDRFAISSAGAQGMMQVMPFWKNEIGRPNDNLTDLETNLKYGCTILKYYLDKAEGRLAEALARYNGSYGSNRYSIKVMDAWERWR